MFRFIGRLYFWLVLVPSFWKFLRPALIKGMVEGIEKRRASMTPKQRDLHDLFYPPARERSAPTNPTDFRRPNTHRFPTGFQAR